MSRVPKFWGIHAEPSRLLIAFLSIMPFVIILYLYLSASADRLIENLDDKLLPSISQMVDAVDRMAFTEDKRTGKYLMMEDTFASLKRIGCGVGLSAFVGLFVGLNLGLFPGLSAIFSSTIRFLSIIPPLAILPILFITLGIDEVGKIALIFLGTVFVIIRDIELCTKSVPVELKVKALTLGASQIQLAYTIILPQIIPRLLESIRLSLGSAWLFLISAESISATEGLGYRIFLVRRYLAMDVIISYVLWITIIGISVDYFLRMVLKFKYSWYLQNK
jgi:NitT/TauT family transport system permease protein